MTSDQIADYYAGEHESRLRNDALNVPEQCAPQNDDIALTEGCPFDLDLRYGSIYARQRLWSSSIHADSVQKQILDLYPEPK